MCNSLTGVDNRGHMTPVLASLHRPPVKSRTLVKNLLTFMVLGGPGGLDH